ncbi:hypothetical protein KI387_022028, partial [Taxus chinensis]
LIGSWDVCVSTVSFSVLVNGSASPFFKPSRGLRQGCHLSTYLFLLVAERLSRAIQEVKRTRDIKGIKVGGEEYLTHILFVHDVLLFTNGFLVEGQKLQETRKLYCKAMGMEVIFHKSTISFNDIDEETQQ